MGSGFADRLRDAMIAADVQGAEELAKRCRVPLLTVERWLQTEGEALTLREGISLRRVLKVRPIWLLDGDGPMLSLEKEPQFGVVAQLVARMPQHQVIEWIDIGEFLSRR